MGYPFCDSDCPSIVTSPRHVARPSVFAFSYAPDNVCQTTLFSDPFCTLSILEGDSYHDSLHLPLSCDQFLKLGVAKRPGLTAICHYWEYTFIKYFPLQSYIMQNLLYFCLTLCKNLLSFCPYKNLLHFWFALNKKTLFFFCISAGLQSRGLSITPPLEHVSSIIH